MHHFDWLKRHAERNPHKPAIFDQGTGRSLTYRQFNRRANRLASFLQSDLAIRPGDRVAILAKNSPQYFEALFACSKIGAILNTLNWRLAVPELTYIMQDCEARVLIHDAEFSQAARVLQKKIRIEHPLVIGDEPSEENALPYATALAQGSPADFAGPQLSYDDTWAIIYTSGTTGQPKGAQVTYGNFFYNAVGSGQAIDLSSRDSNLVVLPAFHIGGLGLFACPTFHCGGTVVVMREFDPALLLRSIEQHSVTVVLLVPAIYLALQQYAGFDSFDLSSVRVWCSGGSPLPASLIQDYAKKGIIIRQGFGMTETGPTVFLISKEDAVDKAGSVGKPVLHTEVCLMDEAHNKLGPNQVGELCIRGNVTSGYWKRPEATAEAIVDGWLHSGDAARYDDDGCYYIVDRWKDMYISGGENVYPAEIEAILYQHPAVAEVAVIGVPDPKWQEVGKAVVVCKPEVEASEQDLIDFMQDKLARYKIPKSVVFVPSLPRNDIGKVLKRVLRQQYA